MARIREPNPKSWHGDKRAFNTSANITFSRLDANPDDDDWAENEAVKVTLAGTLAFLGAARRRGYDLDNGAITYDAVDGLMFLAKNPCPLAHEWYNRVKSSHVDNEPINQTIHDIIQTEFATLATTAADRDFVVVSSLDTSAGGRVLLSRAA